MGQKAGNKRELNRIRNRIYKQVALIVLSVGVSIMLAIAITTAWYTNVTQTGNLEFLVEQFGFTGMVTLQEDPIPIAPGEDGYLDIEMLNTSDLLATTTIRFDKSQMDEEMQKRIYFYADETYVEDEITYDRRYINTQSIQTYDITSQDALMLSEDWYNDSPIKWEWVLDVLGYYVSGTISSGTMEVTEYLQPISYTLEQATFDEDGQLLTVDGTTTKEEFLQSLLGSEASPTTEGYYPVDVAIDATTGDTTGTWLYLCNREEIQAATAYDTACGLLAMDTTKSVSVSYGEEEGQVVTLEDLPVCTVTTVVTGQQKAVSAVEVGSEAVLLSALEGEGTVVIQLVEDITLASNFSLSDGSNVVLDLNGHSLTFSKTSGTNVILWKGSKLTILNGTLEMCSTNVGIYAIGARLLLSQVEMDAPNYALAFSDYGYDVDTVMQIKNSTVVGGSVGVLSQGNGAQTGRESILVIENSTVIGTDYHGINGNGSDSDSESYWGTAIFISDSTVAGLWSSIYHPQQDSTLSIKNSSLSGYTGIAIKGGDVTIEDTTVLGTGAPPTTMSFGSNGYTDSGAGVYVETNYPWTIQVKILGDSVVQSQQGLAVLQYADDAENASILIYSGSFSSDVSDFVHENSTMTLSDTAYVVTENATAQIATMSEIQDSSVISGTKEALFQDEIDALLLEQIEDETATVDDETPSSTAQEEDTTIIVVIPDTLWDSLTQIASEDTADGETAVADETADTTQDDTPVLNVGTDADNTQDVEPETETSSQGNIGSSGSSSQESTESTDSTVEEDADQSDETEPETWTDDEPSTDESTGEGTSEPTTDDGVSADGGDEPSASTESTTTESSTSESTSSESASSDSTPSESATLET